ncbi:hypothetical protein [Streptomyces sp. NPDC052114]|uniref:hypothetical protein n=1 Tax=unclassified Streptomyces TaxID=2593676 RepID=UPI00344783F6
MRLRSPLAFGVTAAAASALVAAVAAVTGAPAVAAEAGGAPGGQVCVVNGRFGAVGERPACGTGASAAGGLTPAYQRRSSATATTTGTRPAANRPAANRPTCAPADSADFPLDTRIQKGPAAYHPGGAPRPWTIELTNTTGEPCRNIHPILVLVDRKQTLRPRQIRLEFHDGARWRPVPFEETDQDEHIGVFDDGFAGFTVGAGRTVGVKVRLAFAPGARADHVVASAALVQRRGDDGDWVGESNDYPFDIVAAPPGTGTGKPLPPRQLAQTGPGVTRALGVTAGALVLVGGALVAGARRVRPARSGR